MDERFFVFSDERGFDTFATESEAMDAAQCDLDSAREACDPEWPRDVTSICWGEIREGIERESSEEDESGVEMVEYQLGPPDQAARLAAERARFEEWWESAWALAVVENLSEKRRAWAGWLAALGLDP